MKSRNILSLFLLMVFIPGCSNLSFTQMTTPGRDDSPQRAQAWVEDIDSLDGMIGIGKALYVAGIEKKTAEEYCNEANNLGSVRKLH